MVEYIIKRLSYCKQIDKIVICTSQNSVDDPLELLALKHNIEIYRGSPSKVSERLVETGKIHKADYLIRITGDNVFTAFEYIDKQISLIHKHELEYLRLEGVPLGTAAEVIKYETLMHCHSNIDPAVSEYLLLYLFDPTLYKCGLLFPLSDDYSHYTLTVDTLDDYHRTLKIIDLAEQPDKITLSLKEIIAILEKNSLKSARLNTNTLINYPYGKTVSWNSFKSDMNSRIEQSVKFYG